MKQSKLSRRDLLDFLDQVESSYPVETWKIDGIYVWPLIKIDLFFRHVKTEGGDDVFFDFLYKKDKAGNLRRLVKALISFFRFAFLFLKKEKRLTVFFSDSSSRREMLHNKYINRYFKPIIDYLETEDSTFSYLTINDDLDNTHRYSKDEPILFLHRYYWGAKIWRKIFGARKRNESLEQFNDFLDELEIPKFKHIFVPNYKQKIYYKVDNILAISQIVLLLIKKHKPQVIFELCYYSALRFGINHAAFLAGVKTVEIQHGGMGRDHVSYSGWKKLPEEGYDLLPQVFWLWDKPSMNLVEKWTKHHGFHSTVLGGNPWIPYVKEKWNGNNFPMDRKIILYTLQYSDIPDHVMQVIKSTPPQFQWWIRLHPRRAESKSIIYKLLMDHGVDSDIFEIERATSYALPLLLSNAYIHISGSSGSIIEAAQIGVFSIIVEEIGMIYYQDLISQGKAQGALNAKEVKDILLSKKMEFITDDLTEDLYKTVAKEILKKGNGISN